MLSEQSIRYSIPILTNTTFSTWKTQILAYCMEYNLDNYLLRDLAAPPAAEADKLERFESRRAKAAGILVCCLWILLTDHYESKAADNQAKVYQDFCNFKFTKDLPTFFDKLNAHLAHMTSVGLKIGIPEKIHIHEHLLSEQIIHKLPKSLSHYKDTLFAKQPLTLKMVKEHLQAKISDSTTINISDSITVKTESALAATTINCSNGVHNAATSQPESKCWQLHLEQKKLSRKSGKKQAKAAVANNDSNTNSSVPSLECWSRLSARTPKQQCSWTQDVQTTCSPRKSTSRATNRCRGLSVQLNNGHGSSFKIKALHVPRIAQHLISSGRLFCKGCVVQKDLSSDLNSPNYQQRFCSGRSPNYLSR
ncbi:hypothetical protein VP01_1229g3 [Puccinia sorghi]|uniref:Uncharacterized protein n=1 Tax=Puccinia sorghi TaxID=27349 RepID=A0A0L6VPS5_9BASI|nr:hypothetical protein VP01_1229g3 [Puccinia sorghi]